MRDKDTPTRSVRSFGSVGTATALAVKLPLTYPGLDSLTNAANARRGAFGPNRYWCHRREL